MLAALTLLNRSPELSSPDLAGDTAGGPATRADTQALIQTLRANADPGDARAAVALGDAYYQRARETGDGRFYPLAERAYDEALAAEPGNVAAISGQATSRSPSTGSRTGSSWRGRHTVPSLRSSPPTPRSSTA